MGFIERLEKEQADLAEKCSKLSEFTVTDTFKGLTAFEQSLLLAQYEMMKGYSSILSRRIIFYKKG